MNLDINVMKHKHEVLCTKSTILIEMWQRNFNSDFKTGIPVRKMKNRIESSPHIYTSNNMDIFTTTWIPYS